MADIETSWKEFRRRIDNLVSQISKQKAVNVNSKELREAAQEAVQFYFRQARIGLEKLGVGADALAEMDELLQSILKLSHGQNAKSSYVRALKGVRQAIPALDIQKELLLGAQSPSGLEDIFESNLERAIYRTLGDLLPSASLSYEQALRDLADQNRVSFRGASAEFREALRETLDHLAPDSDVRDQMEIKQNEKITMKQKVRFILKSRKSAGASRDTTERATELIDELTGALARSVYDRGSLATHVQSTRGEVTKIRHYLNSILAELLKLYDQ